MRTLELKIPPPIVMLFVAVAMQGIATQTPYVEVSTWIRVATTVVFGVIGAVFSFAGMSAFRRAKTTVNPMKPEAASTLVCSGAYRFTRNPMYVGLIFALVAWAVFLASPAALLGPLGLWLYLTRFQILPEERALAAKFGVAYTAYQTKVPRWL